MSSFTEFTAKHNAAAAKFLDTQLNQYLKFVVQQLANFGMHDGDGKKLSQKDLTTIVKGEASAPTTKGGKTKSKAKAAKDDGPKVHKDLTPAKWEKMCKALETIGEDQLINVKSGACVKVKGKDGKKLKRYEDYVTRGHFCGPTELKNAVFWCHKNEPTVEKPEEDDESEDEVEEPAEPEESEEVEEETPESEGTESSDEMPVKKSKVVDDDEDEGEEDEGEDEEKDEDEEDEDEDEDVEDKKYPKGWDKKKVDKLIEAAKKAKSSNEYVNVKSNRKVEKNDKNKAKFIFTKYGFAVPKAEKKLIEELSAFF